MSKVYYIQANGEVGTTEQRWNKTTQTTSCSTLKRRRWI